MPQTNSDISSIARIKAQLIDAVIKGETHRVVSALEEDGTLVNFIDDEGRTPLLLASLMTHFSIVRVLCGFDANVNFADKTGVTPLHAACMKSKNVELMNFLVRQGAAINSVTSLGRTILHGAVETGNEVGVRFALGQGVNVDACHEVGAGVRMTPLALAFTFCENK